MLQIKCIKVAFVFRKKFFSPICRQKKISIVVFYLNINLEVYIS